MTTTTTTNAATNELINRLLPPVVAVVSSAGADKIAATAATATNAASGFSVAQLLQPFSQLNSGIILRDVAGVSQTVHNYRVRFATASELDGLPNLQHTLAEVVSATAQQPTTNVDVTDKHDAAQAALLDTNIISPWYTAYRDVLLRRTGMADHEFLGHPVAVVVVVASTDLNPVQTALQLFPPNALPAPFDRPFVDSNIPRFFVLLHDASSGRSVDEVDQLVRQMKTSFGMQTALLRVNNQISSSIGRVNVQPVWRDLQIGPNSGQFDLPQGDIEVLANFVRDLLTQFVLPYISKTIQQLNENVAASRRGLTGRFFSASKKYFGSASPAPVTPSPSSNLSRSTSSASLSNNSLGGGPGGSGMLYPVNSSEAQLRKLGDYSMFVLDLKFAQQIYDTVKKDYQHDKASKYIAGVQEMLGICSAVLEGVREADPLFEQGVLYYMSRCRLPILATRCTLFAYEFYKIRGYWKELPMLLLRMTTEDDDLRSALLLEQAALSYLRGSPPLIRKYAFHMILAGHRFNKCGQANVAPSNSTSAVTTTATPPPKDISQREHSFRCYSTALVLYNSKQWGLVEEHIYFNLARQSYHLSRVAQSLLFFIRLLSATSQQSAVHHRSYIREFVFIYQHYVNYQQQLLSASKFTSDGDEVQTSQKVTELRTISWTDTSAEGPRQLSRRIVGAESFKINSDGTVWLNLCIPKLNQHSVRLLLDAVATTSGPGITSYTGSSPALLAPNGTLISVSGHGSAASGGDEQIWARMSEQLVVAPTGYSNGSKDTSKGARPLCVLGEPLVVVVELTNPLQVSMILQQVELDYKYAEHDITVTKDPLSDKETVLIKSRTGDSRLDSPPVQIDSLEQVVIGAGETLQIAFTLVPKVEGTINILGLSYLVSGVIRGRQVFDADPSLSLIITKPMPRLAVKLDPQQPPQLLSGEVFCGTLHLSNVGQSALTHARVVLSHPSMVYIGKQQSTEEAEEDAASWTFGSNKLFDPALVTLSGKPSIDASMGIDIGVLEPGTSISLPVWFRGERVGPTVVQFLFVYNATFGPKALAQRILRYSTVVNVASSIKVAHFTRPSARSIDETVIGIEAENLSSTFSVRIDRVSSSSPGWQVQSEDMSAQSILIPPLSSAFLFYRAVPAPFDSSPAHDKKNLCPEIASSRALWHAFLGTDIGLVKPLPNIALYHSDLALKKDNAAQSSPTSIPYLQLLKRSRARWRTRRLVVAFPDVMKTVLPWNVLVNAEGKKLTAEPGFSSDVESGVPFSSFLPLFSTDEIDLTLLWSTEAAGSSNALWNGRRGHHYILGLPCSQLEPLVLPLMAGVGRSFGGDIHGDPVETQQPNWQGVGYSVKLLTRFLKDKRSAALHSAMAKSLSQVAPAGALPVPASSEGPSVGTAREQTSEEIPLKYAVVCPDVVKHDFAVHSLCKVDVQIVLHNLSLSMPILCTIQLASPGSVSAAAAGSQQQQQQPTALKTVNPYPSSWLGPAQLTYVLLPRSKKTINVQLSIAAPIRVDLASGCTILASTLSGAPSLWLGSANANNTELLEQRLHSVPSKIVNPIARQTLLQVVPA